MTSIMAPAHPHATGVAVYPALFFFLLHAVVNQARFWCGRRQMAAVAAEAATVEKTATRYAPVWMIAKEQLQK